MDDGAVEVNHERVDSALFDEEHRVRVREVHAVLVLLAGLDVPGEEVGESEVAWGADLEDVRPRQDEAVADFRDTDDGFGLRVVARPSEACPLGMATVT